jgi:pimeloyl-ACP methyl ester carboxylesterase
MRLPETLLAAVAAISAIACLACATPAVAQVEAGAAYHPRFEDDDCPFEATAQVLEQVRCGWLTVPQDRAEPEGKQLRLAVAILKSTSPTPRPDPIVFLHNAPGAGSVESVPARTMGRSWTGLRAERDIVFYDQRAAGFSEPEFCPEVTDEYVRSLLLGLNAQQRSARMVPALARCAEVMMARGIDLSQYNNVASALDLEDLRRALGYERWNLLGAGCHPGSRPRLRGRRAWSRDEVVWVGLA